MHTIGRNLTVFFLLAGCLQAGAQTTEVELDPVTVTSSIQPVSVSKTGRNIIVLKGEKFKDLPVHSLDELLRYLPGLEVQARGPMGAQSDLVIRGGTFQQVLVIMDGMRLNDPTTGHFNSYMPITPSEIDRIEILKGASAAIYGSEAVGGVIQIITKTFSARKNVKQKTALLQATGGKYNLLAANAGGFYGNGSTAVSGGLLTNNSEGQPQRGTDGYFHLHTASLSVSHFINPHLRVAFRSAYDDRRFSAQNFYTAFASDTATERVKSTWNHAQLSYQQERDRYSLDAAYKTSDDHFAFNPAATPNLNKSQLWQVMAQQAHAFSDEASLVSGVQFIKRSIKSNDRGRHDEDQLAGFVVFNYNFKEGFNFSPALRLDWHERRGTELVPQLNASYKKDKFQLRGSAGKTIRDADFTERYNNYQKALVTGGRIGNPDLTSEHAWAYEAGADLFVKSKIKISASWFQRDHKDLIDYTATPYAQMPRKENLVPGGSYALAKNIAAVTINGIETDVQYETKWTNGNSLFSTLGFVWLDTKTTENTPALYVSSYARLVTNFNLHYAFSRFALGINGLYKLREAQAAAAIGANNARDYMVINGKAEMKWLQNKLSVFTQVDNIFDTNYSDLLGAKMPGRWLMFGVTFTL